MPVSLFVLLLIPRVKKFELIQFQRIPENATVQAVLQQLYQRTSNKELFQPPLTTWIGLHCPTTNTCHFLPGKSFLEGVPEEQIGDEKEVGAAGATTTTSSTTDLFVDTTLPSKAAGGNGSTRADNVSETPSSVRTADFPSPGSQAPDQIVLINDNGKHHNENTTATSPTTTTMDEAMKKKKNGHETDEGMAVDDSSPVLVLEELGNFLVALPQGYKLKHVMKQCRRIVQSPAFGILTQGQVTLPDPTDDGQKEEEKKKKSQQQIIQEELARIKQQKLTHTVKGHLQDQHAHNQATADAYQEQEDDLQARRQQQQQQQQQRNKEEGHTHMSTNPDTHGLSPIDAMRVAQNQQKRKDFYKKEATIQQYHALSPSKIGKKTAVVGMEKDTTSIISDNDSGIHSSSQIPLSSSVTNASVTPENFDIQSQPGTFISPAQEKRKILDDRRAMELQNLRQQGLTSAQTNESPHSFAATSKHDTSPSPSPSPTKLRNRAFKSFVTIPTQSATTQEDRSIPRTSSLQNVRMNPNTGLSLSSSPTATEMDLHNKSLSELQSLKDQGLAKSLKSVIQEQHAMNATTSQAYAAQQKDLEQRKLQTQPFLPSSTQLSAADQQQLQFTKQKQELRAQERKNMGYYTSAESTNGADATASTPKEWKAPGQVLSTQGSQKNQVQKKEWTAAASPQDDSHGTATNKSKIANKVTTEAKQGCACVIQ